MGLQEPVRPQETRVQLYRRNTIYALQQIISLVDAYILQTVAPFVLYLDRAIAYSAIAGKRFKILTG